jgi:hypothetical protein
MKEIPELNASSHASLSDTASGTCLVLVQSRTRLVVELSATTATYSVKVLVALDLATLRGHGRTRPAVTKASRTRAAAARWRRQATVDTVGSVAAVSGLSVIWAGSVVVKAASTTTHRPRLSIIVGSVGIPVAHGGIEHAAHVHAVLHAVAGHAHVQAGQVEATRCAGCLDVVAHGEVTIAIGIAS